MSNTSNHPQTIPNEYFLLRLIPFLLVLIRFGITIILLMDALDKTISEGFVPMLIVAAFLDGIDGVFARHFGVATQRFREADSVLDFIMVVVFIICCWLTQATVITALLPWLVIATVSNILSFIPAIMKFGNLPPLHTYSARAAGGFLFLAAVELFSERRVGIFMNMALIIGFLSQMDRVVITLILPRCPNCDVKGFWHALQIRDESIRKSN